jgi:hypothetical protein
LKNHDASIKNLETQMGQLSKQLSEKQQGKFPSDAIVNPKEQCHAIILSSGNDASHPPQKNLKNQRWRRKHHPKESHVGTNTLTWTHMIIGKTTPSKLDVMIHRIFHPRRQGSNS